MPIKTKHLKKNSLFNYSPEVRTKIEKAAIQVVVSLYQSRGYKIKDVQKDNKGWDLEASIGSNKLLLEVKGQGNHAPYIRISRNEYEKMLQNKDIYRLCVVINSLSEPDVYVFLNQRETIWVCEDDESIRLNINEQVAAIATFQLIPDPPILY